MEPSRFKPLVGSLVIDGALVLSLVWSWSSMSSTLESIDVRLVKLEIASEQRFAGYQRLAAVEVRTDGLTESQERLRIDIVKRLERIEAKLDRIN